MNGRCQPVGGQGIQVFERHPPSPQLGVPVSIGSVNLQSEAKVSLLMLLRGLCKLGVTGELQRTVKERYSPFSEGLERLGL